MARRRTLYVAPVVVALIVALFAWPTFVAIATALARLGGEAWQLDAWDQEPKRRLLASFLDGWRASAPIAAGLGVLALLDHLLLTRYRVTALLAGIALPAALAALAAAVFPVPGDALPALLLTGVGLMLLYRLTDVVLGRF